METTAHFRRLLALWLSVLALTACGFHLRGTGSESIPFETLYLQDTAAPSISRELRRAFTSNHVKMVQGSGDAQVSLELISEKQTKNILSLSGRGKVREYELIYQVNFRIRTAGSELWGPVQEVEIRRDFSYSDTELLAKDFEQARMTTDMHSEAVREIMRRTSLLASGSAGK